jgi:hypothetical protein
MNWRSFVVALLVPVWVTGATLASVSRNRSGGREAIVLSEREVFVSPRTGDDTTARLSLSWHPPSMRRDTWFNAQKLRQLGFAAGVAANAAGAESYYRRLLPRDVFVVLELDGPSWRAFLQERARDVALRPGERTIADELAEKGSRLVVVDAGRDAAMLESRYPDARRHLITAGTARARVVSVPDEPPYIAGTVDRVMPQQIHVPSEWAAQLPNREPGQRPVIPRFEVEIRYGRNYEPWVTAIRSVGRVLLDPPVGLLDRVPGGSKGPALRALSTLPLPPS